MRSVNVKSDLRVRAIAQQILQKLDAEIGEEAAFSVAFALFALAGSILLQDKVGDINKIELIRYLKDLLRQVEAYQPEPIPKEAIQ